MRSFRALPVIVALAAGLSLAGCTTFDPPAMSIEGRVTTHEELFRRLDAQARTAPQSKKGYDPVAAAQVLNGIAQEDIIATALVDRGITVTDLDRQQATALIQQQGGQAGVQVDQAAAQVALARSFGDAELAAGRADGDEIARMLYEQSRAELERPGELCLSAIVITAVPVDASGQPSAEQPTEAQVAQARARAAEAKARLDAGVPIAQVAATYSVAPIEQTEQCIPDGELNPVFQESVGTLQSGQNSEPLYVEQQGAVFIIHVDSRTAATPAPAFEEVRSRYTELVPVVAGFEALQGWYEERARSLNIQVDPRWGVWNRETAQVEPPAGAGVPTTPTTSMDDLIQQLQGAGGGAPSTPTP